MEVEVEVEVQVQVDIFPLFLKTFLPPIAKDVASEHPQSEEQAILKY